MKFMDNNFKNSMSELLESLSQTNKKRNEYLSFIEKDDFESFCPKFQDFLNYSYPSNNMVGAINELSNFVANDNKLQDRIIDFFSKGDFVSEAMILMCLWTHPKNNKESHRVYSEKTENNRYINLWEKGFQVSEKKYKAYCEFFNKTEFLKDKDDFLTRQKAYILNYKLEKSLTNKPKIKKLKI